MQSLWDTFIETKPNGVKQKHIHIFTCSAISACLIPYPSFLIVRSAKESSNVAFLDRRVQGRDLTLMGAGPGF